VRNENATHGNDDICGGKYREPAYHSIEYGTIEIEEINDATSREEKEG
jgi:hypothetical protein